MRENPRMDSKRFTKPADPVLPFDRKEEKPEIETKKEDEESKKREEPKP